MQPEAAGCEIVGHMVSARPRQVGRFSDGEVMVEIWRTSAARTFVCSRCVRDQRSLMELLVWAMRSTRVSHARDGAIRTGLRRQIAGPARPRADHAKVVSRT